MSHTVTPALQLSERAVRAGGQVISDLMSRALADPELISLAAGFVDQHSLPVEPTRRAWESLWNDPSVAQAALQYGTTAGFPPLRETVLSRFLAANACCHELGIDRVVITAGSNQLLHLLSETLLNAGDIVLCTAPTYFVYLGTLSNLGAASVGVTTDRYGMVPEALDRALQAYHEQGELGRVKAIYLIPYFDNPCGITMPLERRARIVEIAKRWSLQQRIHVIADEAYRDLRYEGSDIPSTLTVDDDGDTVAVTGTFSKSFSPGIRVGWGILPEHLVEPVCSQKGNIDFGSPNFSQYLIHQVLQLGLFEPHLEEVREGYRRKLDAMLEALESEFAGMSEVDWICPSGGLYVWLRLPPTVSAHPNASLFHAALREKVLYVPGGYCYPPAGEPAQHNSLRLSFGVQPSEKIREGVASLARAVKSVLETANNKCSHP